jgi:ribonuclease HepT-like protein
MSDGRWFEVDSDVEIAVRHFRQSVALYREGGFDAPRLDGYRATMALMHALQSAHTSLESALVRILDMLGEERPIGDNWHSDLIRRVAAALPGKRPAILAARLARAADETRRFRHRATHTYDDFQAGEAAHTIEAAEILANELEAEILAFKDIIDPPPRKDTGGGECDDGS